MAGRVNLDAMIPREDFAIEEDEFILNLFQDFPMINLGSESPILKLLRKPDFQRETNHWIPAQIATFIASFLDNEVIPSLILWKSPAFIFVIDGAHRLSALRAWMEDDYGDNAISRAFYGNEISDDQIRVARRARRLIEQKVGRFSTLKGAVEVKVSDDMTRRSKLLFTRALTLQWVQGNAGVAETSFYKINSQGTPLDETEEMLIRNRRKPIAISARAILRAGGGHKYWSKFLPDKQREIESLANEFYNLIFEPEVDAPLKTLDVPLGGTVSPVSALVLLVDFLTIAGTRDQKANNIDEYQDDETGDGTVSVLYNGLQIANRISGNFSGSLGLHPAIYFYNENGKYSRFLFLGMAALITDKVRNNDPNFFKNFWLAREKIETFLIENKSLTGIVLQNLSKSQRIPRMRDLFDYLIVEAMAGRVVTPEAAITFLGLRGRIFDVNAIQTATKFSDDTKSAIFLRTAMATALKCPECNGYLDPRKSVSYDHVDRVRDGGTGDRDNGQLLHPFCNSAMKN